MEKSSNNDFCQIAFGSVLCETAVTLNSPNEFDYVDNKVVRMMSKMGFQNGSGLGRHNQGTLKPVGFKSNLGRRGLGHTINGLEYSDLTWNSNLETVVIEETAEWLSSADTPCIKDLDFYNWIKKGPRKTTILDETKYCDSVLLQEVLSAKEIFDEMDEMELCKARSRANPFETVKSAFFMNRAALKMANIDAATNFLFTGVDRQPEHRQSLHPYYFADICSGPGGFSEYIFWRKRWGFKGYGMTLRCDHDFKLTDSCCAASESFQALYGAKGDGDVYVPENIDDFAAKVKWETNGEGVHFVMADGGFSVEGQENMQEILSKQIYICQCLIALKSLRTNGHFIVKMFDLFTSFSVGLLYLMYRCFRKVSILKPNSSRPANSERYLISSQLKNNDETIAIRNYMERIVEMFYQMRTNNALDDFDINDIVPSEIICADQHFLQYIIQSNNTLAKRQLIGVMKLSTFCRNPTLIELRQEEFRVKCLQYWRIPDQTKKPLSHLTADSLIRSIVNNTDFLFSFAKELQNKAELSEILEESDNWHCAFVSSSRTRNLCNIYAGLGRNKVYRFQRNRWLKVKGIELIRGTVLLAELTQEFTEDGQSLNKKSLHVIDALRLGDTSLTDLPFQERRHLISIYCEAINRIYRLDLVNIRPKTIVALNGLSSIYFPKLNTDCAWISSFWTLDAEKRSQHYVLVNSLIFFKTATSESFNSSVRSRLICPLPNVLDIQNINSTERFGLWAKVMNFVEQRHAIF